MDTQDEDYKVLQAMRTEINGLVESKNRLDLEIQELQRRKAQMELETSDVSLKLADATGAYSRKMDELIAKENNLRTLEIDLNSRQSQFEAEMSKKREEIAYSEKVTNDKKAEIEALHNASLDKQRELSILEQRLGAERAQNEVRQADVQKERDRIAGLEAMLDKTAREIHQTRISLDEEKKAFETEKTEIKRLEGELATNSTKLRDEIATKENNLRAREGMIADREREIKRQESVFDTRITKQEAEAVRKLQVELEQKKQALSLEKSQFEVDRQHSYQELHDLNEQINRAKTELSLIEGKIADIERREKGVADSEAGLAAKERQLMFEIAKFKKRVSDAKMEEAINESR